MSDIVNIRLLEPGMKVRLSNDATGEVVTNFNDGVWVTLRFLTSPGDPSLEGTEDMVFAQEIMEVLEAT
jgi:hypothetical protein